MLVILRCIQVCFVQSLLVNYLLDHKGDFEKAN